MKRSNTLWILITFGLFLSACSGIEDKRYLVSIYDMDKRNKSQVVDYYKATKPMLSKAGAAYLDAPVIIDKELPNAAQPAFVTAPPGNFIVIAEFPNQKEMDLYLNNTEVQKVMDSLASIAKREVVFIAEDFNPMGMMADSAQLGSFNYRDQPAFLMLNDISMNSFLNPLTPYRIMSYMDKNFPKLQNAGVKMIMPFEKVADVRGVYDYDVLFLSEWKSEQSFDAFHQESDFVELTKKTRNKAFSRFTESKAHVLTLEN